eukprot:425403-Amphidinium_carterae.1
MMRAGARDHGLYEKVLSLACVIAMTAHIETQTPTCPSNVGALQVALELGSGPLVTCPVSSLIRV